MNIFSKWFGSKDIEEHEDKVEETVCVIESEQDFFPDPQNLPEAFRYVVRKWGADYLRNRSLINILNDFQVLKDIPAAKHILLNMQSNGYIEKIAQASNWEIESKSISTKFSNEFGTKEDIVTYIVECIGYGLKLSTDIPQYNENSETPQPLFADPQKQTTNFIPKQNNPQPVKNTQPQAKATFIEDLEPYDPKRDLENYHYPTLDLLRKYDSDGKPYIDLALQSAIKNRIVDVLRAFGVEISSIKATTGPIITFYEILLAPGMRISKVRNLEDDIALSLSAPGVRILAPIPGKGEVGIEMPNAKPSIVSMESLLNTKKFQESTMDLPCAIGKTITNEVFMFDLTKAPHLLVAGATGQGKSVGLNVILTALLYKKHPAELKFVLVDTKQVEFAPYKPLVNHFLAQLPDADPIITDVPNAIRTLNSLCKLMDVRCDLLKEVGARNIKEYNKKFIERRIPPRGGHGYMPYIVMVIDEFGDLMIESGKEAEALLLRIARLGRLVGIHMVIATRRPISKIITDALKMEFVTRMVFRVSSINDSKLILDRSGAQQLIGRGDMLFMNGIEPERIQCAFVDTSEIERINEYISEQESYRFPYELPDPDLSNDDYGYGDDKDVDMTHLDPLFEDAARLIVLNQSGSTSLVQRKFAIGYNRAGRLMDQLEKAGVVGAAMGSKPREVMIKDEYSLNLILNKYR